MAVVEGQRLAEGSRVRVIVQRAAELRRARHLHVVVAIVCTPPRLLLPAALAAGVRGVRGVRATDDAADTTDADAAGVNAGRAGIVLSVFAGVLVAFLLRSSVLGVRPVMRAISARGLTPLPTDIQFVASSDIRISSESLSSPAMT
jgi:hypothetical protein